MSRMIPIHRIDPHPDADLFPHEEEQVERLRADIEARGIMTPVHVAPEGERFILLTGHDRVEAARRQGLSEVPVEIRSTVITPDDRFEYFVKDNTLRKDVDKRAITKAVWLKYPDSKVQEIADKAGVSVGTAYNARDAAIQEAPQLFKAEKVKGEDGKEYPRQYAPREPKVVDITDRLKPEPAPSKLDQLRQMREAQAAEVASPRIDAKAEAKAIEQEVEQSPANRLTDYIVSLPTPAQYTDDDIKRAVASGLWDAEFERQARLVHALLGRVLSVTDAQEEHHAAG